MNNYKQIKLFPKGEALPSRYGDSANSLVSRIGLIPKRIFFALGITMSADIEKLAVLDSRIVQTRPKFAVEKGALSLTNAPFNAIAATTSQHTYNIYVPSENVFVDRKLMWSSTCHQQMTVTLSTTPSAGDSIVVPGRDFALCALPLNQLCSTLQATINDTTTVINSQDVLREVLRLTDYKKNRLVRTAATMLDKFANYNDAFGCLASPLGGYDAMTDYDNVPNGAFPYLQFTDPAGNPLSHSISGLCGCYLRCCKRHSSI